MRKHISKLMLVLVLLVQMMVSAVAFAEYNADMKKLYGIWGIPNSGNVVEITPDAINGKVYTIVDATDSKGMVYVVIGLGDAAMELVSYDEGKTMEVSVNDGPATKYHKYYRGDDGKLYPY